MSNESILSNKPLKVISLTDTYNRVNEKKNIKTYYDKI